MPIKKQKPRSVKKPKVVKQGVFLCNGMVPKPTFHYVNADHRDFSGFIDELLVTLRRVGIYATYDPTLADTDYYGIVMSTDPINPELLYKGEGDSLQTELDGYEEWVKGFVPPPCLFCVNDLVFVKYRERYTYQVIAVEYRGGAGWGITVHKVGEPDLPEFTYQLLENMLIPVIGRAITN